VEVPVRAFVDRENVAFTFTFAVYPSTITDLRDFKFRFILLEWNRNTEETTHFTSYRTEILEGQVN
jgi:hypothetical protein